MFQFNSAAIIIIGISDISALLPMQTLIYTHGLGASLTRVSLKLLCTNKPNIIISVKISFCCNKFWPQNEKKKSFSRHKVPRFQCSSSESYGRLLRFAH